MDHTLANIYKESIDKEVKFLRKMKAARGELGSAAAMAAARASLSPAQTRQSCQLNFLDQSLGLTKNPHAPTASPTTQAQDLLRWGDTQEGQGRGAYLRTQGGVDIAGCNEGVLMITVCAAAFGSDAVLQAYGRESVRRYALRCSYQSLPLLVAEIGRAHV